MTKIVIEVRRPYKETTTLSFQDGTYVIGRDEGDIVMGDSQVSGRHAEITVQNGVVIFKDLGSTNGSYLEGGARIQGPYTIPVGGVIRMGGCTLVLINAETPDAYGKTILQMAAVQPQSVTAPIEAVQPAPLVGQTLDAGPGSEKRGEAGSFAQGDGADKTSGFQGYLNDLMELLRYAFETLRPRMVEAALPIAIIAIPLPLLAAVLAQIAWFVPLLAPILAIVIAIVVFVASLPLIAALVLLIYPVIARFALALYLGEPVSMGQAWKNHKRNLGQNILNTFVTTLIGGLTLGILGVYIFQIPYVEGKSNVDVNMRSWELFKNSWKRVLFVGFGSCIIFFVPTFIATAILEFVPFLGPIVGAIVWGLMQAVFVPIVFVIISRIYFETREKLEGIDPRPAARTSINEY